MTVSMARSASSHGEEAARIRAAAYAIEMSGRLSLAALLLKRLAGHPDAVTGLTGLAALEERVRELSHELLTAEQTKASQALTVHQLIPARVWEAADSSENLEALALRLQGAMNDDVHQSQDELRDLAGHLNGLSARLEEQAGLLVPLP